MDNEIDIHFCDYEIMLITGLKSLQVGNEKR